MWINWTKALWDRFFRAMYGILSCLGVLFLNVLMVSCISRKVAYRCLGVLLSFGLFCVVYVLLFWCECGIEGMDTFDNVRQCVRFLSVCDAGVGVVSTGMGEKGFLRSLAMFQGELSCGDKELSFCVQVLLVCKCICVLMLHVSVFICVLKIGYLPFAT